MKDHNGLELAKWFDVELPRSTVLSYCLSITIYYLARVCYGLGIKPPFVNYKFERCDNALFQEGFWQDKLFVKQVGTPKLRSNIILNNYNQELLKRICSSESISIHVRRGDYLSDKNQEIFGDICTSSYYKEAVCFLKEKFTNPIFYIFSNDVEYAKELFSSEQNCTYVDGNSGDKSFFDLYLMSHSQGMILANSTFSCWAAYLNNRAKYVCAPHKWVNKGIIPSVNLDSWHIINVDNL